MITRLLSRWGWSMVTLFGTSLLVFFLLNAVPGDVARVIAGPKASKRVLELVRERYHLNDPWWRRLGYFYADPKDSKPGAPVFNRTVTLKDSWAKTEKKP